MPWEDVVPATAEEKKPSKWEDVVPSTTQAPAASSPGFFTGLTQGLGASLSGIPETAKVLRAEAGGDAVVAPPSTTPHSPLSEGIHGSDFYPSNWTQLLGKVGYGLGESAPEMAGALAGGAAGGVVGSAVPGVGTFLGGLAGTFSGAATVSMAKTLGPLVLEEVNKGKSFDEAFSAGLKRASVSSGITGAGFAAFEFTPFKNTVKDLLFQAFAAQPGINIAGKVADKKLQGEKVGWEDVGEAALGSITGTLLPAAGGKMMQKVGQEIGMHSLKFVDKEAYSKISDELKVYLNPAARSPEAERTALSSRARLGEFYHRQTVLQKEMEGFVKEVDKLTPQQQLSFIDAIETKQAQTTPALQAVADGLRTILDERWDRLEDLSRRAGKDITTSYADNYFPHIWKDPEQAKVFFSGRPHDLKQASGFLRKREFSDIKTGISNGLELVTTNPVELTYARIHQYDKYIFGQEIWNDVKEQGYVQFVKTGEKAPEGWQKVPSNIADQYRPSEAGLVKDGTYWGLPTTNLILQRVTETGAFRHQTWYKTLQGLNNGMNSMQLLGPFHLWFITQDTMLSSLSLGLQEMARGRPVKGLVKMSQTPFAPAKAYFLGRRMQKEYLSTHTPYGSGREFSASSQLDGKAVFDKFNKENFGGKLPSDGGIGTFDPAKWKDVFGENPPEAFQKGPFILFNRDMAWREKEFQTVLLHEMAHMAADPAAAHGSGWESIAQRVGMETGMPKAAEEFTFKGKLSKPKGSIPDLPHTVEERAQAVVGEHAPAKLYNPTTKLDKSVGGIARAFGFGPYGSEMSKMVGAFVQAGGRFSLPDIYHDGGRWAAAITPGSKAKTLYGSTIGVMVGMTRKISAPLMENIVPNVKAGVWYEMMKADFERDPHMTTEQMRRVGAGHWDSVEDRLGELNYDLTFMPKTLLDASWLAVRSTGWKFGTFRMGGGALGDLVLQGRRVAKGEFGKVELTDRMAYVMAMSIGLALQGAVYQYLKTGKGPEKIIDYYAPKTGEVNDRGEEVRALPFTYLRDYFGWKHDVVAEAKNSGSPLVQLLRTLPFNEDGSGAAIHTPAMPGEETDWQSEAAGALSRRAEDLEFFLGQFVPIGVKQEAEKNKKAVSSDPNESIGAKIMDQLYGPAPSYIGRDEEVEEMIEFRKEKPAYKKKLRRENQ